MSNTKGEHARRATVVADDGVPIAVHEYGPADAEVTAVFLHGHCMRSQAWSLLREVLASSWRGRVRMVFYDHRGHGDSGHASSDTYTIDQLGRDLGAVIATVAPTGPLLLVGHSMGGMAALTYVRQQPEEVRSRLVGIALISTAAGGLADAGLGRLLRSPVVGAVHVAVRRAPRVAAGSKRVTCFVSGAAMRVARNRGRSVDPRIVVVAAAMAAETSVVTMAGFLASLADFDEAEATTVLAGIPAVVVCGTADLLTPVAHSESLAARLPGAQLVRIAGAGHSIIMDRTSEVAAALDGLVHRVATIGLASAG
ncbi:alpha/beta fold hydrolase [Rhodococcus gannanensis]|uniref:Alpha/beta fold hydrolase n=1 Tax=Rhodococcus gannanensis TaxID=1960308 RepID=A0ABW4P9X5_9NOCA